MKTLRIGVRRAYQPTPREATGTTESRGDSRRWCCAVPHRAVRARGASLSKSREFVRLLLCAACARLVSALCACGARYTAHHDLYHVEKQLGHLGKELICRR